LLIRWTIDGRHVVYGGIGEHTVHVWDHAAGRAGCEAPSLETFTITPTADGGVVFGDQDVVKKLDPATCAVQELYKHDLSVTGIAASRDGRYFVTGGYDQRVILWDVQAGKETRLGAHEAEVMQLAISPDGKVAASTSFDRTVRLWDLEARRERAVLHGFAQFSFHVTFTPDGRFVVASGEDGTVRLWEVATSRGRVLRGHQKRPNRVEITPDGKQIITGSPDGTIRVWQADLAGLPDGPAATRAWLDQLTPARLDEQGHLTN
jgi:WD40 repeat protein